MTARARRADARDNQALLLAAAKEVFAEDGPDAPLDHVARRAGVGNATMYRHFPNRRELVVAVYADEVAELRSRADLDADDAGEALFAWLGLFVEHVRTKRALALSLADPAGDHESLFAGWHAAMNTTAATLLGRARAAGAVAPDVTELDLLLLATGIALSGGEPSRLLTLVRRGASAR
ncbi:helix-turn-helix domain-containing protein [Amycolatopsis sp., V23-08]|uniref:Helix-turn-helix domain-containing protein n=1 Tax=Amycolatopsis heterodermiae TaxID=3110235 RepID=A0ABU5RBY2_9PSEU|nr:helix-turn-helix domain-containing protein [Amycolatopsis sp., V23-08]MEA5363763.1 helix-turn-helix domain-containing protein [Amycolatopsis sp., V23-08]